VPVERVAEEKQEKHRDEQEDHERAFVADDLPELLASDGERFSHGCPARSATTRKTSSSDGGTGPMAETEPPARSSRSSIARGSTPPVGSSRNTIRGSWRMAHPRASRWRHPPARSLVRVCSRP